MTEIPPYPTFQELVHAHTRRNELPGKYGLIWPLTGPLSSISIKIGDSAPVPYCSVADSHNTTLQYHPICLLPLTSPKVASITVKIYELEEWEDEWMNMHFNHFSPSEEPRDDMFQFRSMPDWSDDDEEEEWGGLHLVKCCGVMRPKGKKASLTVTPAEGGEGYLTVRDYVDSVHPWLMGILPLLREGVAEYNETVVGEEVPLSVNCTAYGLDSLTIETELDMDPKQGLEDSDMPVWSTEVGEWATVDELEESLKREYGAENVTVTRPY